MAEADWIPFGYKEEFYYWNGKCSNCGVEIYPDNYCPNCGAKLNIPEDIKHAPDGYCEDAEIEIAHVGYTAEQCGYDK